MRAVSGVATARLRQSAASQSHCRVAPGWLASRSLSPELQIWLFWGRQRYRPHPGNWEGAVACACGGAMKV